MRKESSLEKPRWVGLSTLGGRAKAHETGDREKDPISRTRLRVGTRLHGDRFVVERVIGQGGEGTVYAAFDSRRGHSVALKVLHHEFSDATTQLKREFRFLTNLIHPRLVHLHELFVTEEISFFTMALVEGPSFLEAARDPSLLRKLVVELCEGLSFLHESGRVHRDVKPTNALVRENGELVLVDFGVGRHVGGRLEGDSGPVGTPRYMAPEVVSGLEATAKSDAFSVGVLLYEALTGEHPFESASESATGGAAPPSTLNPEIDADYDAICARLLESDPEKRASVEEALELLTDRISHRSFPHHSQTFRRVRHFVGRDRELGRLGAAHDQARAGKEPVLALVSGRSGFGKTAFVEEFTRFTHGTVLHGSCSEHELVPHKGFDGVIEDLAEHLLALPEERVLELVGDLDARLVVPVFPELRLVPILDRLVPSQTTDAPPRNLRQGAYGAIARIFARLSETTPLTIVIDDLQWSDLDTIRLLGDVFGAESGPSCLVVLAFRSDEASAPAIRALLTGASPLVDRVRTLNVELEPLEDKFAEIILRRHLEAGDHDEEFLSRLLKDCQGCPLLLAEVGLSLASGEPIDESDFGLHAIVEKRKAKLEPAFERAFSLLAAARHLETRFLATLSGTNPERLVIELESVRLARSRDGGKSLFVLHDRIRDLEIENLGSKAEKLHLEIAEGLVRSGGEPATIAHHFMAGAAAPRASIWAERAAHLASRGLALTSAVELFRLALAGEPEGTERAFALKESLAFALADAGHGASAAPLFAELAESSSPELALEFRTRAAAQFLSSGRVEAGWNTLKTVSEIANLPFPETPREAILAVARARAKVWWAEKRSPKRETPSSNLLGKLAACRAGWSLSYVSTAHGAANSARYLELALEAGDPEHLGLAYGMEGLFRATSGSRGAARYVEYREKAERYLAQFDHPYHRAFVGYMYGQGQYLLGEFTKCVIGYEKSEPEFTRGCRDVAWELSSARIFWGSALLMVGRHRELDRRLEEWIADANERNDEYALAALTIYRARRVSLREGDMAKAKMLLEEAAERWKTQYLSVHRAMGTFTRVALHLSEGELDDAAKAIASLRDEMSSSLMNRVQIVRTSYCQSYGLVLCHRLALGVGENRRALLREVARTVTRLRDEGSELAGAYAEQLDGYHAFHSGDSAGAYTIFEHAIARFNALGMSSFANCQRLQLAADPDAPKSEALAIAAARALSQVDILVRPESITQYAAPLVRPV